MALEKVGYITSVNWNEGSDKGNATRLFTILVIASYGPFRGVRSTVSSKDNAYPSSQDGLLLAEFTYHFFSSRVEYSNPRCIYQFSKIQGKRYLLLVHKMYDALLIFSFFFLFSNVPKQNFFHLFAQKYCFICCPNIGSSSFVTSGRSHCLRRFLMIESIQLLSRKILSQKPQSMWPINITKCVPISGIFEGAKIISEMLAYRVLYPEARHHRYSNSSQVFSSRKPAIANFSICIIVNHSMMEPITYGKQ